ncbi:MAG: cyclic-di-AMP receptor [Eubacteriales bacterium]|nr:cyclic-di-AMP receptor [Eubacteriales bacterium]
MILAILQGDDYPEAIAELNEHGFYATVLRSTGGFLRKPSATIMIGLNHAYLDEALALLRRYGERTEMQYQPALGMPSVPTPTVPIPVHCGGVVLFVLDVEQSLKY